MNELQRKLKIAIDIDNTLIVHEGAIPNMIVRLQTALMNGPEKRNRRIVESDWREEGCFCITPDEKEADSIKVIRRLAEEGHEIIVLSSRPGMSPIKYLTEWSLDKHGIPYHKLVLNCQNKADYCRERDIDVLIDDNEVTCKRVVEKNPETLVINFAGERKGDEYLDYVRSNNWRIIQDKIEDRAAALGYPSAQ